ncbi:MAG: LUD domain-containing protein [Desulfocucumaceae bacterium]
MVNIDASFEEALDRARNTAAVLNAKRLGIKTPCVQLGRCVDCDSQERICRVTVIIDRCPSSTPTPTHVIVVGEELGY